MFGQKMSAYAGIKKIDRVYCYVFLSSGFAAIASSVHIYPFDSVGVCFAMVWDERS